MLGRIDASEYESVIRQEAKRRFDNNQRRQVEGMSNVERAWMQHHIGVAGEVAARLYYDLDPYGVTEDQYGAPDFILDGTKIDVKVILQPRRILNVQFYEGVLEHKKDWAIQVMAYEGFGWRFNVDRVLRYKDLKTIPLAEASGGHRSKRWEIHL